EVALDALPGRTFSAVLTRIAPAAVHGKDKEAAAVFPVEARLTTRDAAIKPGMSGELRIHVARLAKVPQLSVGAVINHGGRAWVTRPVARAGVTTTDRVAVQTGASSGGAIEIRAGVAPGERVLLTPPSSAANEPRS